MKHYCRDANHDFRMAIVGELEASSVREFAMAVDAQYESALMDLVWYSEATTELLSNDKVAHFYHLFQR